MRKRPPPTAERIRHLFNYDPDTGVITLRVRSGKNWMPGRVLGMISPTTGRMMIAVDGHKESYSRIAWLHVYGVWTTELVDHADGNVFNNRISNLRIATSSQNIANSKFSMANTVGFKGASPVQNSETFRAQIGVNGKSVHLGCFFCPEEAAEAYDRAALKYFGPFAKTNKSMGLLP